ncbi:MAG: TAXI family TRAP transporter solute-binding subunit [Alphaproteobacteria bacterium]|nr:TAXI family TRAP transporter solute-binding subunit [Alphaproteobacteria bacterium]
MVSRILFAAAVGIGLVSGAASAQQKSMTLGTASVGGTYFVYGGVVANLLTQKLGTNVSTQQTQGPNQNVILTDGKQVELGMTTMGVALQAWNGAGEWTKGKKYNNIRAVFPMYDTPFHFITTEKSGIKKVADMKGKRVGVGPKAGTCGTYFPLMFKALDLNADVRFGQASDMASQLGDGLLDAFPFCAGVPISVYSELEAQRPVVFFTYTADELAKIKKAIPELSDSTIPKGTYKSQAEDHKTVGLYNFFIVHKDMDADTVYKIAKAVLENNADMVKGHAAAKETLIENWTKNTFLPFHPGAVKYYKEKGIAIPKNLGG